METAPDTTVIAPLQPLELKATTFFRWIVIGQKLVEPAERQTNVQQNTLEGEYIVTYTQKTLDTLEPDAATVERELRARNVPLVLIHKTDIDF